LATADSFFEPFCITDFDNDISGNDIFYPRVPWLEFI